MAQIFIDICGLSIVKNGTFYVKLLRNLFGQLLQKIGLLFTPTSGRTESDLSIFVKVFSCPTWANENKVVCRSLSSHFCTSANKYFALKMENFLKVFNTLFKFGQLVH